MQLPISQAPVVGVVVAVGEVDVDVVVEAAAAISLRHARAPHKSGDLRCLE